MTPAMRQALAGFAVLALCFIALTVVVGLGDSTATDLTAAQAFGRLWNVPLGGVAKAVAVLGGVEVTGLVALGLAAYLWRRGFRVEVWFLAVFAAVEVMETLYKHLLRHPAPGARISHGDGPSLTALFESAAGGNSFPSGHMVRAVFVYGLLAFVVLRLAPPASAWRRLAVPLAAVMILLMALDRLYLGVHWESDVVGGGLLGGLGLAAAVIWLDRPRPELP